MRPPRLNPRRRTWLAAAALAVAAGALALVLTRGGRAVDGPVPAPQAPSAFAEDVVALLEADGAERAPAQAPAADDDPSSVLAELRAALAARDAEAAARLVERWFRTVPDPARAILDGIATNPEGPGEAAAFGVLLASAMEIARLGGASVQPWTPESLASAAIASFPSGAHAATALCTGLRGAGSYLPGRVLGELVLVQTGEGVGALSLDGQAQCMALAEAWATSMPPEADLALLETFAADENDPFAHGQSAKLLLLRDWRAHLEPLLQVESARAESREAEDDSDVAFHLAAQLERLTPSERIEYAQRVFRAPSVAAHLACRMDAEDSAALLAEPGVEIPEDARRWLEFQAGGDRALAAGIEILGGATGDPRLGWNVAFGTLVERGASGHPEFEAALQKQFDARAGGRGLFWGALSQAVAKAPDDVTLLRTFVPLVEASAGEKNPHRDRLLAALRARLPNQVLQ